MKVHAENKYVETNWFKSVLFALLITCVAFALRFWPLDDLGYQLPYLTFYPAVMLAALVGVFLLA